MVTAKLIGQSDGYTVWREFDDEVRAIKWLKGAGLAEFGDQTALGEVWADGKLIWTRANLQTPENRERDRMRYSARWRAGAFDIDREGNT